MTNPALNNLRDIHLPKAISLWPPAWGWWLVAALLLFTIIITIYLVRQRFLRFYIKKQALKQLTHIKDNYLVQQDSHLVAAISALLKRVCLAYYPREQCASLYGHAWLVFLDEKARQPIFQQNQHASLLIQGPYQAHLNADLTPLFSLVETWLHSVEHQRSQYV